MNIPWYGFLLIRPRQITENLERAVDAGVVDEAPNTWQLCLGVLRMWHRVLFRTETIGTCAANAVRPNWRARLLKNRAARLPCLLAEGAVAPLDFTGLASSPDRLIRHLLGAHHDGQQFVFDLQILSSHPGKLEQLLELAREVAASDSPRARWLRDLTVYEDYHDHLVDAVRRAVEAGVDLTGVDVDDPDITFSAYMRWCARQPRTPATTARAWLDGRFTIEDGLLSAPAFGLDRGQLLTMNRRQLENQLRAGHAVDLSELRDTEYRGISLGLPDWVESLTWKKFKKTFAAAADGSLRGWNVRIVQDGLDQPWRPMMRGGRPIEFGHFDVDSEPDGTAMLRYRGAMRFVHDPLVALGPGDSSRLLGRSVLALGGRQVGTPSYFLLERDGPLSDRARATRGA